MRQCELRGVAQQVLLVVQYTLCELALHSTRGISPESTPRLRQSSVAHAHNFQLVNIDTLRRAKVESHPRMHGGPGQVGHP